jgi:pimeloyl-ACP methyl ester carboxylesterase
MGDQGGVSEGRRHPGIPELLRNWPGWRWLTLSYVHRPASRATADRARHSPSTCSPYGERAGGRAPPERVPSAQARYLRQSVVLPGCGHWIQQERPAEVNSALISFLRSV